MNVEGPTLDTNFLVQRSRKMDSTIMDKVIEKATENVKAGGGPFAAAIVRDGEIISLEVRVRHSPA